MYRYFASILMVALFLAISTYAMADRIKMENGQVHKGTITAEEDDRIQIKLEDSGARIWLKRDQISSIEEASAEKESDDLPDITVIVDEDVLRARELLEQMGTQGSNTPSKKIEDPASSEAKTPTQSSLPPDSTTSPPAASSTTTATEVKPVPKKKPVDPKKVEKAIDQLRFAKSPIDQSNAAIELGKYGDEAAIPHLIQALEDKSYGVRNQANKALIKITGIDLGYNAQARGTARNWAVGEWEKWYREKKRKKARENLKAIW